MLDQLGNDERFVNESGRCYQSEVLSVGNLVLPYASKVISACWCFPTSAFFSVRTVPLKRKRTTFRVFRDMLMHHQYTVAASLIHAIQTQATATTCSRISISRNPSRPTVRIKYVQVQRLSHRGVCADPCFAITTFISQLHKQDLFQLFG